MPSPPNPHHVCGVKAQTDRYSRQTPERPDSPEEEASTIVFEMRLLVIYRGQHLW